MEAYCLTPRGSSPHTRGALRQVRLGGTGRRIIPAYAGSTSSVWTRLGPSSDHPRIRGEHGRGDGVLLPARGSSPHTRGALQLVDLGVVRARIIPAYAGSTGEGMNARAPLTDHPRIRGEHSVVTVTPFSSMGSSPHTRGAPGRTIPAPASGRIIPAYAGSTDRNTFGVFHYWDHPRIRGEHWMTAPAPEMTAGSSPHTRGAP